MIAAGQLPRLLASEAGSPTSLDQHLQRFGELTWSGDLTSELERAGLTGRGGAGFPTWRKVQLLRQQRAGKKFVVVNAMEGEPAAHKDHTLLATNPHLVLDGALLLAQAIGATHIAVCVDRNKSAMVNAMKRAIHERSRRSERGPRIDLHTPPGRYVAGEESALVHWLDNGASLPQYRPQRPTILKIGRGPALVDNAETCAHIGLIGRYGAEWFRSLGTTESPGSTLVSLTGALAHPVVVEVALGTPLRDIVAAAGGDPAPQAVLLGGYGGTWLSGEYLDTPYCNEALRPLGVGVGAGVLVVLPRHACGIHETWRIAKYMANESARQCGPCAFGLPAIADDLGHLATVGRDLSQVLGRLEQRCGVVVGRGACAHPDGVVRMVRSALHVFRDDVDRHIRGAACAGSRAATKFAPVPSLEREEDLVWE